MRVACDFETRSTVDLKDTGVYPYAAHPDTDVWCLAFAVDDGPVDLWTPGMPVPAAITAAIAADAAGNPVEFRAWNANFERLIWREIMVPRYGFPPLAMERWVCTMAEALAMALPAQLGQAALVLGVTEQKDMAGKDLMQRMARPRRMEGGRPVWWDEPERKARLYAYCQQDVETERAIVPCLRRLSPTERAVYLLDQRMNDRGIAIDRPLVEAAQAIALEGTRRADAALTAITNGAVTGNKNHGKLLAWVRAQGVDVASVDKASVMQLLAGALPPAVRAALVVRAEAGRTSVAKLESMAQAAGADDRLRGLLFYHGATTGRWSGRLVQPQNFPRGEVEGVERFIPAVLDRNYDAIDLFEPPVKVVSSLLRACLVAAPGHVLVAADYSAIEARVLNWLAGQDDIVALFARGEDVYRHNAAKLYRIPLAEVQKFPHRHTGKFQELACGFQMGAKKAVIAAKDVYGLDLVAMHGSAEAAFEKAKEIVQGYRATHPAVVDLWYATERACLDAVRTPGVPRRFGAEERLTAVCAGAYLYVKLPSGRLLCYPSPKVVDAETPWSREARLEAEAARAQHLAEGCDGPPPEIPPVETKPSLEFATLNQNRQWARERTYGGKLVENIVQAVARDLMAEASIRAEAAGFAPVLLVHDEVVCETTPDADVSQFERILATTPDWARGCPIAAEGWMDTRYRK